MCLPVLGLVGSLIGTAVSAGLTIAQMDAQNQKEYEQKEAANRYYTQNRENAVVAANNKYVSLQRTAHDERGSAAVNLFEKRIESLKKKHSAMASAGEGGVTGLSVAALDQNFVAEYARAESAIQQNLYNTLGGIHDEMDATYHQTVGRINSVQPGSPIPTYSTPYSYRNFQEPV